MRRYWLWLVVPLLLMTVSPAVAAQYVVTVSANAGGKVTGLNKGKNLVEAGSSPSVVFTADDGYYLASVKVDKEAPQTPSDPKTFTKDFPAIAVNHTISAKFARDPFITASVTAGGTIDPPGKVYVPYGTDQTFAISANTGYHVTKVLKNGAPVEPLPESVPFTNVTAKQSLKVYFTVNTYSVTTELVGPGGAPSPGSISPSMGTMKHGQTKIFTVKPATGMKVAEVLVNDVAQTGLPASGPYKVAVTATADTKITVTFAEIVLEGAEKLKGTYNLVMAADSFNVSGNGGTYVNTNRGGTRATATFNGAGGCSISFKGTWYSRQSNGGNQVVEVEPDEGAMKSCSYSINSDGVVTINMTTPDGPESLTGFASSDGNVFVAGGPDESTDQYGSNYDVNLFVGVKAGSSITKASLSGTYHLLSHETSFWKGTYDGISYVSDSIYGNNIRASFDGNGGCSVSENGVGYYVNGENVDESPENSSTDNCTYSVSSTGAVTIKLQDDEGPFTVTGWASADGNTFVTGGVSQDVESDGTGYNVEITTGVREGSNMSRESLSGTYKFASRNTEFWKSAQGGNVGFSLSADLISVVFDGAGGCTVELNGKSYSAFGNSFNNDISSGTAAACSYIVGTTGNLYMTVTTDSTDTITGWVSTDGNTILIGGPKSDTESDGTGYGVDMAVGVKVK